MCGTGQSTCGNSPEEEEFMNNKKGDFQLWARQSRFDRQTYTELAPDAHRSSAIFRKKEELGLPLKAPTIDRRLLIVQENNDLDEEGDYAPGIYKAMTTNLKLHLEENNIENQEEIMALIECDFNPFQKSDDLYKGKSLAILDSEFGERKFESDVTHSVVFDNARAFLDRTNYATHEKVFEKTHEELKSIVEIEDGYWKDDEFPPDKSSILGYGLEGGEPRDRSA